MLDDPRDVHDLSHRDPIRDRYAKMTDEGFGYGPVFGLLAIVLIIGGLIAFAPRNENVQTAANRPATEQVAPAPVAPAPRTTAPTSPQ